MEPKNEKDVLFDVGENVFARVKGHPAWPAVVQNIVEDSQKRQKYEVLFYGSSQKAVCKPDSLYTYKLFKEKFGLRNKRSKDFNRALDLIEEAESNNENKARKKVNHKKNLRLDIDKEDDQNKDTNLPLEDDGKASIKDDSKGNKLNMAVGTKNRIDKVGSTAIESDAPVEYAGTDASSDLEIISVQMGKNAKSDVKESSHRNRKSDRSQASGKRVIEEFDVNETQKKRPRKRSVSAASEEENVLGSVAKKVPDINGGDVNKRGTFPTSNDQLTDKGTPVTKQKRKTTKPLKYIPQEVNPRFSDSKVKEKVLQSELHSKQKEKKRGNSGLQKSAKVTKDQHTKKIDLKQKDRAYQRGDKVFAKVRGYSPWPAVITAPASSKPPHLKYHVSFYGTLETALCKVTDIYPYELYTSTCGVPKNKSQAFQRALADIKKASG